MKPYDDRSSPYFMDDDARLGDWEYLVDERIPELEQEIDRLRAERDEARAWARVLFANDGWAVGKWADQSIRCLVVECERDEARRWAGRMMRERDELAVDAANWRELVW